MPLIDLTFPKVELEGKHLSLQMFEDRTSTEKLSEYSSAAEVAVRLNINGLFSGSFTNNLQQKLNSQPYTCVVTAPFKLNVLIERIKEIGHKLVYVVSHDPTLPTHQEAKKTLQAKLQNILFGYESSWTGHKLLPHHTAPAHIQMSACAQADHVLINSWEPTWLIGGICEMRKALGISPACEFMLQDPWIVDPWKHI